MRGGITGEGAVPGADEAACPSETGRAGSYAYMGGRGLWLVRGGVTGEGAVPGADEAARLWRVEEELGHM